MGDKHAQSKIPRLNTSEWLQDDSWTASGNKGEPSQIICWI